MQVPSLGREDPLEEEMATHSRIIAWRIPWTEEPGGLQSIGLQESKMTWQINHHHHPVRIPKKLVNGVTLCWENERGWSGEAGLLTVHIFMRF